MLFASTLMVVPAPRPSKKSPSESGFVATAVTLRSRTVWVPTLLKISAPMADESSPPLKQNESRNTPTDSTSTSQGTEPSRFVLAMILSTTPPVIEMTPLEFGASTSTSERVVPVWTTKAPKPRSLTRLITGRSPVCPWTLPAVIRTVWSIG